MGILLQIMKKMQICLLPWKLQNVANWQHWEVVILNIERKSALGTIFKTSIIVLFLGDLWY